MGQILHLAECDPDQHPDWQQSTITAMSATGAVLCDQTAYMAGELMPDEPLWVQTTVDPPAGFEPRTPQPPPAWLHTIELDADGNLAGTVLVVHHQHLPAIAYHLSMTAVDARGLVVYEDTTHFWVRLTREQTVTVESKVGTVGGGSPHYIPGAYHTLIPITNIMDNEEED